MYLLRCLTVLLVAALVSDVSALPLNNCTARYQAALDEVLTIKEQCEGAAFYDCCQVSSTSKLNYTVESKLTLSRPAILSNRCGSLIVHAYVTVPGRYQHYSDFQSSCLKCCSTELPLRERLICTAYTNEVFMHLCSMYEPHPQRKFYATAL